jgi:hypothetical protein
MRIALLTQQQLDGLRPGLGTINTSLARRGNANPRMPSRLHPPANYSPGARGWTIPTAIYPQLNGSIVVVMEVPAWERLKPASRALFRELEVWDYPPGFNEGEAVPWP